MEKRDYYEVLSIGREANDAEIKSAYRRLAMQHHPDRNQDNPEAEEAFKEASEAYSVLADAQKRAAYDRYGHAAVNGAAAGGGAGFDPSQFSDFSDIFGDFFGFGDLFGAGGARGGRGRNRAQRGGDLRYDLEIAFEEALHGVSPDIKFQRLEVCDSCRGKRTRGGAPPAPCGTCKGAGQVRFQQGFFSVARTCGACGGAGVVIRDPCPTCRGQGRVPREVKRQIAVPAGVEDGMQLRLTGEGESGAQGGPSGDLYILIHVRPHPFFQRKGTELYCSIPVSFPQAALGCQITVPTPWGNELTSVAAGTPSGAELPALKGKGAPRVNARGRGDLHVFVQIDVPKKFTKEQKQLLVELDRLMPNQNAPHDAGIFEKVRDLFG